MNSTKKKFVSYCPKCHTGVIIGDWSKLPKPIKNSSNMHSARFTEENICFIKDILPKDFDYSRFRKKPYDAYWDIDRLSNSIKCPVCGHEIKIEHETKIQIIFVAVDLYPKLDERFGQAGYYEYWDCAKFLYEKDGNTIAEAMLF